MKLSDLKEQETIVKIVNKNSDWYGLYGIVDFTDNDCVYIFCVSKPTYHYKITQENINDIEIINFEHPQKINLNELPHYTINSTKQLKVGDRVGVVVDNEWFNSMGLVSFIHNNNVYIQCYGKVHTYKVTNNNINDIILF